MLPSVAPHSGAVTADTGGFSRERNWIRDAQLIKTEKLNNIASMVTDITGTPIGISDADGRILAGNIAADRTNGQPITCNDECIGQVFSDNAARSQSIARLLGDIITSDLGVEAELNDLSSELLEKYEEINLLYDFGESLGTILDAEAVYSIVLERGTELTQSARAIILTPDINTGDMNITAARGIAKEDTAACTGLSRAAAELVIREGKAILLESAGQLTYEISGECDTSICRDWYPFPILGVPLNAKEKNLGVIILWDKEGDIGYNAGDLKLISTMASQAAISLYNSRLIEELKESERIQRDMEIAARMQLSLLPAKAPDIGNIDLAGKCVPALNTGGDYYDYLPLSGDKLGIVIADVSGHNIVATLGIAATRGVLRAEMMRSRSAAGVLERTNRLVYDDLTAAELFISAFYAIYNQRSGELIYSNGGHNPPFIYRAASGECADLNADGLLLGVLDDADYEEQSVKIAPGDILVLYTDGVTEAMNKTGEQFGDTRLQSIIVKNRESSSREIIDEVLSQVYNHTAGHTQYDDITIVVMKVNGHGRSQNRFAVN